MNNFLEVIRKTLNVNFNQIIKLYLNKKEYRIFFELYKDDGLTDLNFSYHTFLEPSYIEQLKVLTDWIILGKGSIQITDEYIEEKNYIKMKKEEFLTYLKKYSSNNTEILLKRDSIVDDISNGKIPTCCIANWIETVKPCDNNVYELDTANQIQQCEKCWKRFLK